MRSSGLVIYADLTQFARLDSLEDFDICEKHMVAHVLWHAAGRVGEQAAVCTARSNHQQAKKRTTKSFKSLAPGVPPSPWWKTILGFICEITFHTTNLGTLLLQIMNQVRFIAHYYVNTATPHLLPECHFQTL